MVESGTQSEVAYEPDEEFRVVALARSFNGRHRSADAGLAIALTPLTTMTLGLTREQQRFALSPDRNSSSWRVAPTFTFSPAGLLTGVASIGYRRFEPVSPAVPSFAGLYSNVAIGATIYGRHHMLAGVTRDVQYSYDLGSTYYLSTGGTITWTWLLAGPVDVRGTAARQHMDYRQAQAPDTLISYGGGAGYRFSNRARFGINVLWQRRDSEISADRAFRNHRIFAGLSWGSTL